MFKLLGLTVGTLLLAGFVSILVFPWVFGTFRVVKEKSGEPMNTNYQETSTELDLKIAKPFLNRLPKFINSGFSEPEIVQVMKTFDSLKQDERKDIVFPIVFDSTKTELKITVHKEDFDTIGLYFYSFPPLNNKIKEEMAKFCKELGI